MQHGDDSNAFDRGIEYALLNSFAGAAGRWRVRPRSYFRWMSETRSRSRFLHISAVIVLTFPRSADLQWPQRKWFTTSRDPSATRRGLIDASHAVSQRRRCPPPGTGYRFGPGRPRTAPKKML